MANKSQLKAVGEQDFSESDPFAELTRIMGFDPRVQPTPRPEDDFQIDLEKELMGEFGGADERDDAHRQADSSAGLHESAPRTEVVQPVSEASSYPPADDLEDALTSVFQQELGEESDAYASSVEASDEAVLLPHQQEIAAATEEPHLFPVEGESETDNFDRASSPLEPASVAMGEVEAVEDRGPELAESLNQLLSNAGYRSGSSYSGTAQVYQMSASYVAAPPAAEPSASNETRADEPTAIASENPEQAQFSTQHRSTVFGTTPPEWDGGISAPSEPAGSDIPSAFDAPFDEMETDIAAYHEPQDGFGAKSSSESEEVRKPEDPFAALAALGSEPSPQRFHEETPVPAPVPASDRPVGESRRFEGAARFYSSLDLFSRATPVAPGMRQPPRVVEPAPLPGQEMLEPVPESTLAAGEEETAFAEPVWAPEDEPDLTGPDEAYSDVPADARETEMRGEAASAAEAGAQSSAPAQAMPHAYALGSDRGPVSAAPASMPEIETIDVPEKVVAIADDLDIPTPPVEEIPPPVPAFDDLDHEFVAAFSDLQNKSPVTARQPALSNEDEELTAKIEELFSAEEFDFSEHESPVRAQAAVPARAANPAAQTRALAEGAYAPETYAFQDEYHDPASAYAEMPEETSAYHSSRPLAVFKKRRALVVDAVIGCVFVAMAIGAYAYSHHSTKTSGPVLLKADAHPVKMKPKHPGGTKVPNQDNQVYKRVADGDVAQPVQQQKLVSSQEKPVDLSAQANNGAASGASVLPGVDMPKIPQASSQEIAALAKSDADQTQKNQDRVAPSQATGADTSRADDVIAVVPRKVRTMIVKPDGTMVPTPLPAATPAAAPKTVATAALEEPAVKAPAGAKSAAAAEHLQQPASNGTVVTPEHVDIAPSRPPVQQVSVKEPARSEPANNEKVASLGAAPAHPAAATAAAAGWAMQIASQPSAQAAQTSYQHLAHRYGSVLGGHGVDIVKAEIAGKGTYYRVRVPASSREEAIALCTKYKAAGGNCFVSK